MKSAKKKKKANPGLLMSKHQILQQMIPHLGQLLPEIVAAYLPSKLNTPRVARKRGTITVMD